MGQSITTYVVFGLPLVPEDELEEGQPWQRLADDDYDEWADTLQGFEPTMRDPYMLPESDETRADQIEAYHEELRAFRESAFLPELAFAGQVEWSWPAVIYPTLPGYEIKSWNGDPIDVTTLTLPSGVGHVTSQLLDFCDRGDVEIRSRIPAWFVVTSFG